MRSRAVLLLLLVLATVPAWADDRWTRDLAGPAERLWNPLPPGSRIAIRPLDADETGLPDALAREVEQALAAALLATAPAGGGVASRRDLPAAWEEAESFAGADGGRLLRDAAVDAVVVPSLVERRDGVALSAVLVGVTAGGIGDVIAVMPATPLAVDVARFDLASADAGARRLGVALAEQLRRAADPVGAFSVRIARGGPRSPVTDWLAAQVGDHLARRLAMPPLYVTAPLRRLGEGPKATRVILEVEIWDLGARVDIQAQARMDGHAVSGTARVAMRSLPPDFLPLTRDGGRVGPGMYQAEGAAALARRVDPREQRMAARAVARRAVIRDALDWTPAEGPVRSSGDVQAAMESLQAAIPHEEIWRDLAGAGAVARVLLRARVSRLGGGTAPVIEAAADRAVYRPGDALTARVQLRAGRAYLAAYAWQADDTVIRIAPMSAEAARVDAKVRVDVPGTGDPAVSAAPMPGSPESVEAIVIVASALPFDAAALAPSVQATASQSLEAATDMSAFLDALARLDLARVTLRVLPYRVRPAD